MRKLILTAIFPILLTSCSSFLEDYLDRSVESGLTHEEVFTKYSNYKLFFDAVYEGLPFNLRQAHPLYQDMWNLGSTWCMLTDMSDEGMLQWAQTFKQGTIQGTISAWTYRGGQRPILEAMFVLIRTCNITLQNIDMLQDASETDKYDLIAQAHFIRAYCYFTLFRIWGPMPYMTEPLSVDDNWDMPRLSKHETCMKIAQDCEVAAEYFRLAERMRRDATPGEPGHLNSPDQFRPNGVAAIALKGRALLYAASPLNNELGVKDWEEAAKANWEAIASANEFGYTLMDSANYKSNYVGSKYTNEQIWGFYAGAYAYNSVFLKSLVNSVFANQLSGAECPTQNFVDRFETKWGDPLKTEAERNTAVALGHYNEQNPYINRDPRLSICVIYNQAPLIGYGKAQIYYQNVAGNITYSELLNERYPGITYTGYYQRKRWGDQSVKNKVTTMSSDPLIRLGEVYLNYAEAANEAYGPNTPAPGATLTAVDAINIIRNRIGMPNVQSKYIANKEVFRERIKNERTIELCFEGGHYYFDVRRWMDAPMVNTSVLTGMDIEKVTVSSEYPTGFKYSRKPLPDNRQIKWKEAMYYLPFPLQDYHKMKNFVPNEYW